MAPRGLFEKPIVDAEEGSKIETSPALLFGLVATVVIVLMVLIGVSGKGVTSHMTPQNAVTSSAQN